MQGSDIPTIDLERQSKTDVENLDRAFQEAGLVYIKNHGISEDELERFYTDFLVTLEALEESGEEEGYIRPDLWFQRGLTPPNTEEAVLGEDQPDFKKCWFASPNTPFPEDLKRQWPRLCSDNIWPPSRDFRESHEKINRTMKHVSSRFSQLVNKTLARVAGERNLSVDLTEDNENGLDLVRTLEYLPVSESPFSTEDVLWGEKHTDLNLWTFLPGGRFFDESHSDFFTSVDDLDAGLWITVGPDEEVQGQPPEGAIIAQVGQQLEILSGGRWVATPHEVRPPAGREDLQRVSMAYFSHARPNRMLYPIEEFRTEKSEEMYQPPRSTGQLHYVVLDEINLAQDDPISEMGYPLEQHPKLNADGG